jgi:Ca2+-binding EF-hand superfamily protein
MLRRTNIVFAVAMLVATCAIPGIAAAQKQSVPKPAVPQPQEKRSLVQYEVTRLLLLMDTDKDGKVSKQEFIKFMEAEFDRLDKNKTGDLDVGQLKQSKLRASQIASVGK